LYETALPKGIAMATRKAVMYVQEATDDLLDDEVMVRTGL
jgi:hypothetical protein